ncbi:hypothetical protein EFR84_07815 [Rhizobium chutanense]|uniref:Uncharacterized protein n=1 Tax=Rhizobium chutanense TaxID=2035448 RepID=A0A432P689_9HYPH|nr:hypothetical protein EFR84_07815 [Rhizobium chutanense]
MEAEQAVLEHSRSPPIGGICCEENKSPNLATEILFFHAKDLTISKSVMNDVLVAVIALKEPE